MKFYTAVKIGELQVHSSTGMSLTNNARQKNFSQKNAYSVALFFFFLFFFHTKYRWRQNETIVWQKLVNGDALKGNKGLLTKIRKQSLHIPLWLGKRMPQGEDAGSL